MILAASYCLSGMPYADVNGLYLYFEKHGTGFPLVLLHGGLLTIELSFGAVIPTLAERHRVIAVELQGHGRTADVDRPMRFEYLAADVVGLLDHLGVDRADVFGFSLGGLTTYQLLVDHPGRVRRAVVASADHRNDRGGEIRPDRLPSEADFVSMRDAYASVAPDPAHFEAFAEKTVALVHSFAGWSDEQLQGIEVPVLVLIGDTDFILVPYAAEAAELLPQGQLSRPTYDRTHRPNPQPICAPGRRSLPRCGAVNRHRGHDAGAGPNRRRWRNHDSHHDAKRRRQQRRKLTVQRSGDH
jgi:pimeloyl-ACP methyl ester carboxylesterase